mmetsp:Transcript_27552/g.31729  ORF Transcript_27552/g.31729 Transcript_27552/m.31729 type:complete len:85 (-) Transcript_27552:325-579(-)
MEFSDKTGKRDGSKETSIKRITRDQNVPSSIVLLSESGFVDLTKQFLGSITTNTTSDLPKNSTTSTEGKAFSNENNSTAPTSYR